MAIVRPARDQALRLQYKLATFTLGQRPRLVASKKCGSLWARIFAGQADIGVEGPRE